MFFRHVSAHTGLESIFSPGEKKKKLLVIEYLVDISYVAWDLVPSLNSGIDPEWFKANNISHPTGHSMGM